MSKKLVETQRLEVVVERRVVERLDQLAVRMGWSRNQVAAWLLELETSDLEWVLNKFAARVRGVLRKGG